MLWHPQHPHALCSPNDGFHLLHTAWQFRNSPIAFEMIYVFGVSHAVSVLEAYCGRKPAVNHDNFLTVTTEQPRFEEAVPVRDWGLSAPLRSYIAPIRHGWGSMAWIERAGGNATVQVHPGFLELMRSAEPEGSNDVIFAFINGNEHTVLSMVQHPQPYDFVVPWASGLPLHQGRQILPFEFIAAQVAQETATAATITLALKLLKPGFRIVFVIPPPPIPSEEQLKRVPEVFRAAFERHGVTPATIRLKYYLTYRREMEQQMKIHGIEMLDVPPQAVDAQGFLKQEYWHGSTHGNAAYGALVLHSMAGCLATGAAA